MPLSLHTPLAEQFRLTAIQKSALQRLGLKTVEDLLYHFPSRYGDTVEAMNIESLKRGDEAVVFGRISGLEASKGFKTKMTMAEAVVRDETGEIQCVWFNQPYIAKMIAEDSLVRIQGKVSERRANQKLYFSNPKIEVIADVPIAVGSSLFGSDGKAHALYPVYPESRGISSSWIYHALQKIFKAGALDIIEDPIPGSILVKYHLPSIKTALLWIHAPMKQEDALVARKRFSFEEIFTIQLGKQRARLDYASFPTFDIETDMKHVNEFVRRFPFQATAAQNRTIETIVSDMKRGQAMTRLLEGDVGSGKTAVAAAASYAVISSRSVSRLQIAYMCPTEILATQHFESFIQYFSYMPIQIALITSSGCRKFPSKVNPKGWTDISRAQLLKWVENGEISVVIGTHSLIQETVKFKHLALAIIDEQHRFGTAQRAKLIRKNESPGSGVGNVPPQRTVSASAEAAPHSPSPPLGPKVASKAHSLHHPPAPHFLSMTATPIPRTLALTMFGDLDLSVLDESPAGRKPIITELVLKNKRDEVYEKVRLELQAGRQAYIICPRIDEPDPDKEAALNARSVKEEAKRLQASVFPEFKVDILHGKMKPADKDHAMNEFNAGKINILCATSVVEVGVNVPNATVIIIEGAERFGLSQLHQLRGRVMRSSHQAYCYAFTETNSEKSIARLKALQTAKNGFELAELDLAQRGIGELSGARQWGVSDVAMEALKNLKMVEAARTEASKLIARDKDLSEFPALKKRVEISSKESHFE